MEKSLFAVEKSKDAFFNFKHNLINKNSNFYLAWMVALKKNHDINNIIEEHEESLRKVFDEEKISCNLGGPPCQGFSMAGRRRKEEDDRNKLIDSYIKFYWASST